MNGGKTNDSATCCSQRPHAHERQVRIDVRQRLRHQRLERAGRQLGDEHQPADEVRLQLDPRHHARSRSSRSARAARRTSAAPAGRSASPANFASRTTPTIVKVPTFSGSSRPKCWPIGSSSLLKKRLHERLVDDRDRRGRFVVGRGESAPAHHRRRRGSAGSARSRDPTTRPRCSLELRRRMAGDENQLAPVVGQRVVEREARACTPGRRFSRSSSVRYSAVSCGRCRSRTAGSSRPGRDRGTVNPKSWCCDVVQAAREHRRAGDEHDGQRGLDDEQRRARERRMIARRPARAAQRVDRIGARREPGGRGAEERRR